MNDELMVSNCTLNGACYWSSNINSVWAESQQRLLSSVSIIQCVMGVFVMNQ